MNTKELKQQRIQLFRDAANSKRTERIPQFAAESLLTWTLAGTEFHNIWELLSPILTTK